MPKNFFAMEGAAAMVPVVLRILASALRRFYSYRSATIGSVRIARRAGI